jgi:hypothetical protein
VTNTTVMTPSQRSRPARRALIGVGVQSSMALTPQVVAAPTSTKDAGFDPSQHSAVIGIGPGVGR